jgi:hypothetical protein
MQISAKNRGELKCGKNVIRGNLGNNGKGGGSNNLIALIPARHVISI